MPLDARPVCPQCGGTPRDGRHGELTCVQHGTWYPAASLARALGPAAARLADLAARAPACGRRCPQDRSALAMVTSPSGNVTVEACGRCGGAWLPTAALDAVVRATPAPAGATAAEARALLGLGAVRSVLGVRPPEAGARR